MALFPGDSAPEFSLVHKSASGLDRVSLSSHRGERAVVLLFFPFAFTRVCTEEMCTMSGDLASFEALDAAVYGVSVDSPFALEEMARKEGISFPLLSDFNKEAATAYRCLADDFKGLHGVAKRSAFVIDKEGIIQFAWVSEDPRALPDFTALKAALA